MMISIGTYKDIDSKYDQIWFIMRSIRNIPQVNNTKVLHIPELSPSPNLFRKYIYWREQKDWGKKLFEQSYVPKFLADMQSPEAVLMLEELYKLGHDTNILLVCSCKDNLLCHRKVVMSLIAGKAHEEQDTIIQFNGLPSNYLDYWEAYKRFDNRFILNHERCNWDRQNKFSLIVAGSRGYSDYEEICTILDYVLQRKVSEGNTIEIVSGGAKGADMMAHNYAISRGFASKIIEANWDRYGKSAGYKRNESMHTYTSLTSNEQRGCICFWDRESRGTKHNFKLARENGTQLVVYDYINHRFMKKEEIDSHIE